MKVLVTRKIPAAGIEILSPHVELDVNDSTETLPPEMLKQRLRDCAGVLCLLTDQMDREVMAAAPGLKVISNHAVGVDNIDITEATARNIVVTNTPDVLTAATADFAWALLLGISRHVLAGDRMMRSGQFPGWDPQMLLGADLTGKTLGVLGSGRIGSAFAERSAGWRMNVLYFSRRRNEQLEKTLNAKKASLQEVLQRSDFISIHLPLTPETHHLIGEAELNKMKASAYLINTARGPIIDEQALVKALAAKTIAGAALDVYEKEPEVMPGLADLDNVLLAPHIGSATIETRNKMAEIAALNILHVLQGREPVSRVN